MAQMNLSTEKKIMDLENRLVVAKGEREEVGWTGCGVNRCRLLPLEWISNGRSCCEALGTMSSH